MTNSSGRCEGVARESAGRHRPNPTCRTADPSTALTPPTSTCRRRSPAAAAWPPADSPECDTFLCIAWVRVRAQNPPVWCPLDSNDWDLKENRLGDYIVIAGDAATPLFYRTECASTCISALTDINTVLNKAVTHDSVTLIFFLIFCRCSTFLSMFFENLGDCQKFHYSTNRNLSDAYMYKWYQRCGSGFYKYKWKTQPRYWYRCL